MRRIEVVLCILTVAVAVLVARTRGEQRVSRQSTDQHRIATYVTDHGAIPGDGQDDTRAFQNAIVAALRYGAGTLVVPRGEFDLSSSVFPKRLSVQFANGALLRIPRGATVRFDGPMDAGRWTVFAGDGNVRFGTGAVSAVFPQWWGASPQSTDCSPAINRAIAASPDLSGVQVRLTGTLHCKTTIHVNRHRVNLVGDGMYATRFLFDPDEPAPLFHFANPDGGVLVQCGLRDVGMVAAGEYPGPDRVKKVGVLIEDADVFSLENVAIHNWGGNESVGIQVQGRELVHVDNVTILADLPILIDKNPRLDWISIDHSTFRNTYLLPMDKNGPSVKIASGVALHNVVFDGTHAWVGGKYGLHWVDTETKGVGVNLTVKNVRMENGAAHGGAMIHIAHNYSLQNLVLENIYGCGGGVGGIYLRKCANVTMQNVYYTPVRGNAPADYQPTALDIDESSANIACINAFFSGGTIKTGHLVKTLGTHTNPSRYENRVIEVYDRPNNEQGEGVVIYGTKTWSHSGVLRSGERLPLPIARNTKVATVTLAASGANSVNESAQFMVGGDGSVIRVVGTQATSATATDGRLCLVRGDSGVQLVNNLQETVDVVLTASWK